tara:strand:- start:299 stop:1864 length:1566 start_codon:yes stop_codon:yes gene_type:complete
MSLPLSLENTLRAHDRAVWDWLGSLRVDYDAGPGLNGPTPNFPWPARKGVPILRTMATRMRVFATIVDLLVHQGWISPDAEESLRRDHAGQFQVLPLPIVTFERGDPIPDALATNVPARIRRRQAQSDGTVVTHQYPSVYLLPYTATFWMHSRYTEAYVREWLLAQVGKIGMGDQEVLIPVQHAEPFGVKLQALSIEGTADQSDLEGDNPRYIRFEVSMQLRMLFFRAPLETGYPVEAISIPASLPNTTDGMTTDAFDRQDIPHEPVESANFVVLSVEDSAGWPLEGATQVQVSELAPMSPSATGSLFAQLDAVTDRLVLTENSVDVTASAQVLSVSLYYLSTAEVDIVVQQRVEGVSTWTDARREILPASATWREIQFFAVVEDPIFRVVIEGRAIPSEFFVHDPRVTRVFAQAPEEKTSSTTAGVHTKHVWAGLTPSSSYLVMVVPSATPAAGIFTLSNDDSAPTFALSRPFVASSEVGYAEVIQPRIGTVALQVPAGYPVGDMKLVPYRGLFRGRLNG